METTKGKPELGPLHRIRWKEVAAGIWMFLPLMELAATCPDQPDEDITCPLNELPGLRCSYVKGLSPHLPEPVGSIDCPGPVKDVGVDTVVKYDSKSVCTTFLNITWYINPLANPRYLLGFLLNVTFNYDGVGRNILRTYNLSIDDWNNMDIYKTAFRHECIIPAQGTAYQIRIHSLPLSTLNAANYVDYFLTTAEDYKEAALMLCDKPTNTDYTYNWRAMMWSKQNPSEDSFSSLEICFFLAPVEFGFRSYRISLLNSTNEMVLSEMYVHDDGTKNRKVCGKFSDICPGVYKAWVMPVNDPWCVCRAGPYQDNPDNCKDSCAATELSPIDMSEGVCSSTQLTTTPSTSTSNNLVVDTKIIVVPAVVGGCLGISVIVTAVILCIRLRLRDRSRNYMPRPQNEEVELPVSKKSVLLVYSTDNESHRKVIRSFATFLHACCGCEVLYDEWSQVDIAQTNSINWLSKQMYGVKNVIIVNSLGAYKQHRGWVEQKLYVPDSNLLLPDVFIPAIRQIWNKTYLDKPQFRCFHVCFPYTKQKHVLDLSCGRCYRLMDHIEDLFLHIHGLTKFSAKGTVFANQINAKSYVDSKEGKALYDAIEEASGYADEHSDWFYKYFRQEVIESDIKTSFLYSQFHNNDLLASPLSVKDDDDETSNLGSTSDIENGSASVERAHSGEAESQVASPDFGIGGMNYDSLFEDSCSPPGFGFSPLPPDDPDILSSIGSQSFVERVNELNRQFDSGFPSSSYDFRTSLSDC